MGKQLILLILLCTSDTQGPKPIFFDNFTADSFHFEFFCFGERSAQFIEFGAEQCT